MYSSDGFLVELWILKILYPLSSKISCRVLIYNIHFNIFHNAMSTFITNNILIRIQKETFRFTIAEFCMLGVTKLLLIHSFIIYIPVNLIPTWIDLTRRECHDIFMKTYSCIIEFTLKFIEYHLFVSKLHIQKPKRIHFMTIESITNN